MLPKELDRKEPLEKEPEPAPSQNVPEEGESEPPRKFSFGSNQELESSISTKMVSEIHTDEIEETLPSNVETPTFLKRGSNMTPRFMESQLELSTRVSTQPKEHKVPQIRIERYVKQTEMLSTVVRYELRTAN